MGLHSDSFNLGLTVSPYQDRVHLRDHGTTLIVRLQPVLLKHAGTRYGYISSNPEILMSNIGILEERMYGKFALLAINGDVIQAFCQ